MYITYGKVFGGDSEKFYVLVIFPENGSILEQTVNRGINSSHKPIRFCINKQKILIFNFRHVPKLSIGFNDEPKLGQLLRNMTQWEWVNLAQIFVKMSLQKADQNKGPFLNRYGVWPH